MQQTTIEIHIGAIELRGRPASTSPAPVTAATAAPETGNQTGNLAAYLARRSRGGAT
ncbi:hypothetical protein [Ensifer sp.]|uniref:hypothetical protein n=1 Tax=Ensifer sp. TaxID=1872086 RepID=UPI002E0D97A2|nr:hypothetical protein [Ensifer sp.]